MLTAEHKRSQPWLSLTLHPIAWSPPDSALQCYADHNGMRMFMGLPSVVLLFALPHLALWMLTATKLHMGMESNAQPAHLSRLAFDASKYTHGTSRFAPLLQVLLMVSHSGKNKHRRASMSRMVKR